jgi:hypothetical protein
MKTLLLTLSVCSIFFSACSSMPSLGFRLDTATGPKLTIDLQLTQPTTNHVTTPIEAH